MVSGAVVVDEIHMQHGRCSSVGKKAKTQSFDFYVTFLLVGRHTPFHMLLTFTCPPQHPQPYQLYVEAVSELTASVYASPGPLSWAVFARIWRYFCNTKSNGALLLYDPICIAAFVTQISSLPRSQTYFGLDLFFQILSDVLCTLHMLEAITTSVIPLGLFHFTSLWFWFTGLLGSASALGDCSFDASLVLFLIFLIDDRCLIFPP